MNHKDIDTKDDFGNDGMNKGIQNGLDCLCHVLNKKWSFQLEFVIYIIYDWSVKNYYSLLVILPIT